MLRIGYYKFLKLCFVLFCLLITTNFLLLNTKKSNFRLQTDAGANLFYFALLCFKHNLRLKSCFLHIYSIVSMKRQEDFYT
jgi:hypothetical protein